MADLEQRGQAHDPDRRSDVGLPSASAAPHVRVARHQSRSAAAAGDDQRRHQSVQHGVEIIAL